jgi:hypothetical protein
LKTALTLPKRQVACWRENSKGNCGSAQSEKGWIPQRKASATEQKLACMLLLIGAIVPKCAARKQQ